MALKKKIIISIIIILSILFLITAGFFITFQFAKISYKGAEKGNVLSDVIITRSEKGIPLITASSVDDIFYALGYIHAQDRLNIMEYQRALATGTVSHFMAKPESELLDRLSSIIGFTMEAETLYEKLDSDIKNRISRYTDGVNRIRHTRHLAKIGKNDWTPYDVLSILLMKEWGEAYLANTELLFAFNEIKRDEIAKIFPGNDKFHYYSDDDLQHLYVLQRVRALVEQYIGVFNSGFAVHIDQAMNSADNRSFTAFSYTASYDIYPGWYPVNIKSGDELIYAVTYNGLPFFFTFKKGEDFFTHFSINADSQDFMLLSTRKNNNTYQYNLLGTWKDFKPVRIPQGSDRTVNTLRWITEKGPILSDLISSEKQSDQILCINSVHPGPNYVKILAGAPFEQEPSKLKNLLLSSDSTLKGFLLKTDRNSLKIYSGLVTTPDSGKNVFLNGSLAYKPDFTGVSVSRNITGTDYIGSDLTTGRDIQSLRPAILTTNSLRLNKMISLLPARKIYTENYVQELVADTHSGAAEIFIPLFRQILESTPLTSAKMARIYYNDWDYTTRHKLQAPAIFYTTLNFMIDETFRDEFGNDTDTLLKNVHLIYDDFYQVFNKNQAAVFDNIKTDQIETRETVFDKAFLISMRYLNRKKGPLMENWKWGELNRGFYKIPNITSNLYSRFFILDEIPANGAPDSLYLTSFSPEFKPLTATALTGFMADDKFSFKMNYAYSSSILSDFYYGRIHRVQSDSSRGSDASYEIVIKPM